MSKYLVHTSAILLLFFASCNSALTPDKLYGKWKYTKVEHPNDNPPDSLKSAELAAQSPSIEFIKDNKYVINWGGRILSHGTFTVNERNIQIKEEMSDGTTREFPFYVSELTANEMVFDTKGEDGSKVTAVKE